MLDRQSFYFHILSDFASGNEQNAHCFTASEKDRRIYIYCYHNTIHNKWYEVLEKVGEPTIKWRAHVNSIKLLTAFSEHNLFRRMMKFKMRETIAIKNAQGRFYHLINCFNINTMPKTIAIVSIETLATNPTKSRIVLEFVLSWRPCVLFDSNKHSTVSMRTNDTCE